jgi:hypothetical protein
MPQIKREDYDKLFKLLSLRKIPIFRLKVPAFKLKAAQNEIDETKVKEWIKSIPPGAKDKPLLVSADLYILDGNHTWAALYNRDPEIEVDCFFIGQPMEELLKTIKLFDRITYKTIDEHDELINTLKRII